MMKQRTIAVARYLNKERMASYREIASQLGENERAIRYDVDQINDELKLRKCGQIEKYPKGMLFVPDDLNLAAILENSEFVFSPQERVSIVRLYALFHVEKLNIRVLCDDLQVSRRTIQNDIGVVQKELEKRQMKLSYDRGFRLQETGDIGFDMRSSEMQKYIAQLYRKQSQSSYGVYIRQLVEQMMEPISLDDVLAWIDFVINTMGWTLSDETFQWYVAHVLTFTWYIKQKRLFPNLLYEEDSEIANLIPRYEALIGRTLEYDERGILSSFSKYTNRYVYFDLNADLMSAEDIALLLVKQMGKELHMDFSQDGILMKGLLNHVSAMLKRVRDHMQLQEDVSDFLPEEYTYVYTALKNVLKEHEELYALTENEMIYLVMYFLGSIRRIQESKFQSVLLICGFGYGTTTVVKDALINEYQVFVKKSISAYQLATFDGWDEIDVVISTVNVDLPVERPFAQVNVIFQKEDYIKLDLLGLRKRNILTNYLAIERKLDFLSEADRQKVLEVIQEELGYRDVRVPQKYYTLSDLLSKDAIICVDHIDDWRDAVRMCTDILQKAGKIEPSYHDSIIRGMEAQGFYSVTDNVMALLHGSESEGVRVSCMSLLISKEPIYFGDKQTNIVFCLASKDKKEHTPAIISLMRMISMTKFINLLEVCRDADMAGTVIETCENYAKMQQWQKGIG